MCVNVRLQTFCPMLMWSLHLPAFNCLRYIQVTTPFSVTFVLLLGKKKCEAHEFACDNNTLCYLKTEKCDGVYDCMDWSDEQGCSKYYFNRPNSYLRNISTVSAASQISYWKFSKLTIKVLEPHQQLTAKSWINRIIWIMYWIHILSKLCYWINLL